MEIIVWLALIIFFVVLEIATVGLTSIWLAGGSLAGLICAAFGMGITGQIIVFAAVSFVLLYFTRPWALKYLKPHLVKTNYEEAVGKDTWKCHYWRDGFHHKWKISNHFRTLHAVCLRLVR